MSLTQRIPTAAWDAYKEQIRMLYVVEDKTLDDTIKSMNENHGFLATKSQYVRKLKNWGMEKYINGDKWKIAFDLIQKRKQSGKEKTELSIDGKVIPVKRMKKEMSRYSYYQRGFGGLSVMPADASSGIIAYTPPSNDTFRVTFNTIPWLRFQSSMGSVSFRSGIEFLLPRVENSHPSGIANPVPELRKALLADVNRSDRFSTSSSILEEEAKSRENNPQIKQLLQSQPLLQILQHAVYMSSNSFLSIEGLRNFTDWIADNNYSWAIESFVQLKGPSIAIFASNLLLSAIDRQKVVLVRALLVGGANPNCRDTYPYFPRTALQVAAQKQKLDLC